MKEMEPQSNYFNDIGFNLSKYRISNIKVVLIPSTPGRHQGEEMQRQGIIKLRRVMQKFNKMKNPVLTYNSTSLGVIDYELTRTLYDCFSPNAKPFDLSKFRLIYPTLRYVQEETGGQAQVLFLKY